MEKETRDYLNAQGYTEEFLKEKRIEENRAYFERETSQMSQIMVASLSMGFSVLNTLLPYNKDGVPTNWIKGIKRLNYDSPHREQALENVLVFLKSRYSERRYFNVGHDKYCKDEVVLNKNHTPAKIEFPSAFTQETYIIKPDIFVMPNGDAVLQIKKKGGEYIGYFVIDSVSRMLPDIETIVTDNTLCYPALTEHRMKIRREHPEIQFSPEVLEDM